MITIQFIVKKQDQNKRIDKLIVDRYPEYSRSLIQKWITNQYITVNGHAVKPNYKCDENDQITGTIKKAPSITVKPENIPLEIIYEDSELLIVNKPKGMVVHPSNGHQTGTLVNALRFHCKYLSTIGGEERPGIVHRIDKDTSGLLIIAKDDNTHQALAEQFIEKKVKRIYGAIVHGVIEYDHGTIEAPIGRDPKHRLRMAVVDQGKEALTHFKVINRFNHFTYVECQLETGRTHQIRVHMDYIGHPLVGDPKYSQKRFENQSGQALFSKELAFIHPKTKEEMHFKIDEPAYFRNLLKELANDA